ncbi:hypothetical protein VPH35_060165 [Triticum aestivum]|uniref:zinc finger CCCH domain-containing protein 13 isoform X1 n=1 Tax=Triticum aestivum TaxID=4565 RepID=UPI001D02522F|nr:zinc finger CCCH domain-containing protein 13-like isoform X1 [Triticum aestivum]
MPRSSRHRSSHRSHRRGGSAERSESEGEDAGAPGPQEEAPAVARVPRDPEPERRRSSSAKELVSSGNGYSEHGKKRKDRVEETVVDVVSDRWNSGVCEDHLVEKRSKSEVFGPVDVEKQAEKPKASGDEPKRSSRRTAGSDGRAEEVVSKSDSGKRRSEKEKDPGRRESSGQHKDDRDRDRERDREKEREREKEWERLKERERERGRDREREKEKEREREKEKERERERERDKERDRERERERDRERERERQKDRERDKKDYDSKHEKYEDGSARKNGSKTSRGEDEGYSYKRHIEINDTPAKERHSNPDRDRETDKHSRRKDDSEDKDKWPIDNRDSDDRKTLSRYDHGKVRSSKEQRFDDEKYKQKYKDDYERDKRQQDDKCLDECMIRDHGSDRVDYKSTKDGHRISEGHYRKDIVQDGDRYDEYGSRYKENRGRKRLPEENDDHYDLKTPSAREQRGNLEKSSGSGRLDSLIERARSEHRHQENVDSSPSKVHARTSPGSNPHHEKDPSWHGSKLADNTKREIQYDERSIRPRTSSGRERTPASRLRDRDTDNWSSERLKQKDDLQSRDIPLEISTSSQYDRTPRKDTHPSPKQLSDKSPSSNDQRFSGRLSSGRSLDNKGERSNLTKYRDRDGDLSLERSLHQDRTPSKIPYRESTPSASSISRGGHFSGTSPNRPLLPPARHRDDSSFLGSHDDDRRPQSGDRRFHGHQKRNDMNSGRGHGHAWNNAPSWPSQVANGFVPMQHGAPGFHPPVHQFHPPPMFNLRPQMKLSQTGVSYPMHDTVDRFSPHIRPFGWPNPLDESLPPHLQVWNGGTGVFGGEPYMYGRQEWDQNKLHVGSRGWEATGDALKGQNELPDTEFPVAKKELDSLATPVFESSGGQCNLNPYEQKEANHLISEKHEAKGDVSAVKSSDAPRGTTLMASMLSSNGTAVFSRNYLSRVSVSHDLVESELYKRCTSLLGGLGMANGGPDVVWNGSIQKNGNAGKISREQGSPNLLGLFYLKNNDATFQRAMALHKNQTERAVAPTQAQTDGKMDLTQENNEDTEMLDRIPLKELTVSNPVLHHRTGIIEGPPATTESGDVDSPPAITESGDVNAPRAITESGDVDAPPGITESGDTEMVAPPITARPDEDMEVAASPSITEPDKNMEDVPPPAVAVPADGPADGATGLIIEHIDGSQEAPSANEEPGDTVEVMPPAFTEQSGQVKDDPPSVATPNSGEAVSMHAAVEKDMDEVTDDSPGDGEVNASNFVSELDVVASGAQDCEGVLVEGSLNLSRIPNSPESTH